MKRSIELERRWMGKRKMDDSRGHLRQKTDERESQPTWFDGLKVCKVLLFFDRPWYLISRALQVTENNLLRTESVSAVQETDHKQCRMSWCIRLR